MLEAYQAFADYHDMMDLIEGMIVAAARAALGDDLVVHYGGHAHRPRRHPVAAEAVRRHDRRDDRGARCTPACRSTRRARCSTGSGWPCETGWGSGRLMKEVYDEKVQHDVVGPVFCIDYPREVSPLARVHRDDPDYVERFELIVAGFELCNAYSEQNDPVAQLAAFEAEARAKAAATPRPATSTRTTCARSNRACRCTGGLGIGIDRLVMLLASVDSIREVILFPTLRPEFAPRRAAARERRAAARSRRTRRRPPTADGVRRSSRCPTWRRRPTPSRPRPSRTGAPRAARVLAALTGAAGAAAAARRRSPSCTPGSTGRRRLAPLWAAGGRPRGLGGRRAAARLARRPARRAQAARLAGRGGALRRRARVAHLLKGPHPVAAVICVGLLLRPAVLPRTTSARRPTRRRCCGCCASSRSTWSPWPCSASSRCGPRAIASSPEVHSGGVLETIFGGLVGLDGPYTYASPFFAALLPGRAGGAGHRGRSSCSPCCCSGRSPNGTRTPRTTGRTRTRLVHTYGWDTLAYFALRDDKSFFFAHDGEAFLAYTYLGGYALVAGDPIGRRESVVAVLDEFLAFCEERAWNPALLAVREASMPLYRSRGFSAFYLGDEAIIDCRPVHADGAARKSLRSAVRRVGRTLHVPDASGVAGLADAGRAAQRDQRAVAGEEPGARVHDVAVARTSSGGREPRVPAVRRARRRRHAGRLPASRPRVRSPFGYTLDLMRHDPDAPNGMTEFLIASTARGPARERGVGRLSMNFATWGRLFDDDVPFTAGQRARRWLVGAQPVLPDPVAARLQRQFGPEWLPRCSPRGGAPTCRGSGCSTPAPRASCRCRGSGGCSCRRRSVASPRRSLARAGGGPPGRLNGRS